MDAVARPRIPPGRDDASASLDIDSLFRAHAGELMSLAVAALGRRDEAEDLLQDVFARAFRGLPNLRDPSRVRSWLITIAIRQARTRLRQRALQRLVFRGPEQIDTAEITDRSASPEERAQIAKLFRALDRLPADLRIAWVLRHVDEEKMETIAGLCGCSLSTARRRVDSAQERLSRRLGR